MASASGLNFDQRINCRDRVVEAAMLCVRRRAGIHYTQGSARWQGINQHLLARHGHYPDYCDCSSFATWCLWNGLHISYGKPDLVNGARWQAGFTGTMVRHGKRVYDLRNLQRGDCIIYGPGPNGSHTAICVGKRNGVMMVASHGSERGPVYVPYNYRRDILQARRYI